MSWRQKALDLAVPIGFGTALCLLSPLRTALEFGSDEGYELMKAFLVSRGHPLYREVWNDQPPLHTEMVAFLFRLFGPSAYAARLFTVIFAVVLVGSLYKVVSYRSGRVAGLIAAGLLLSSSYFLQLSVSVMLELPAMALAMASVLAWTEYSTGKGKYWLALSGMLFGCALQMKLTAVIFLPALFGEYFANEFQHAGNAKGAKRRILWVLEPNALVWCGAALAAFGFILVAFYHPGTITVFLVSHFSIATRKIVASGAAYGFRPAALLENVALLAAATIGVAFVGYERRWNLLTPAILFVTAFVAHLFYRPYWYYYTLHFAVPMAWLGAIGIMGWFRVIWKYRLLKSMPARLCLGIGWLAWSAVVALVLTMAPGRVWEQVMSIRAASPAADDRIVIALKRHAAQTHWIFTDCRICAFWAGTPIPPEVAVIPWKRIWSDQASPAVILQCLERYQPEEILLRSDWQEKFQLSQYIREHYHLDPGELEGTLYLRDGSPGGQR
jgi:4-amino-4-deoxy-L-arabinose transferase-like glycosyltransferase